MSNVTGLYLGRVEICLELLRKTNDIALQCTSKPLCKHPIKDVYLGC